MTGPVLDETLIQKRGQAYRESQVVAHSHYCDPIDRTNGRLAGKSHVWGDADAATQSAVVDTLVEAAQRAGLDAHRTAYVLAIARAESGFNPDAAAGTTSAYGLGQFIDRTAAHYGINDRNRGDLATQAEALVAHFIDNEALARRRGQGEDYIYKYHHDGPTGDYGGLALSRQKVVPYVDRFERSLIARTQPQPRRDTAWNSVLLDNVESPSVGSAPAANGLRHLQHLLTRLGYHDARGHRLRVDGVWGARTEEAVKAFQHAHRLPEVGRVGPRTRAALRRSERAPSPLDPVHPDHALQQQVSAGIDALGARSPARTPRQRARLEAALLPLARGHGLHRADHVLVGRDGATLFLVQGGLDDPAHRRVGVSLQAAFATPLAQSRRRLAHAEFQCLQATELPRGADVAVDPQMVRSWSAPGSQTSLR